MLRLIRVGDEIALERLDPSGLSSHLVYLTGKPKDGVSLCRDHLAQQEDRFLVGEIDRPLGERPLRGRVLRKRPSQRLVEFFFKRPHSASL